MHAVCIPVYPAASFRLQRQNMFSYQITRTSGSHVHLTGLFLPASSKYGIIAIECMLNVKNTKPEMYKHCEVWEKPLVSL